MYKVYSEDEAEENKIFTFSGRINEVALEVDTVTYKIPLGFKIVGVLLRDEVAIQDFLIMRVHLTKEYRAICERGSGKKKKKKKGDFDVNSFF